MDAKKILNKVRAQEIKTRITITVDPKVLEDFKKICGDRSVSPVIEEMLREFVDSAKKDK